MNVLRPLLFRSRVARSGATVAGHPAAGTGRLGHRDLSWRVVPVDKVAAAIAAPPAGRIRERLAARIAAHPDDQRIRVLDIETGATGRVPAAARDAFVRALVVDCDGPAPCAGSGSADLDGLPFRLTVGPDWARLRHTHALGDGTATWQFLGTLLTDDQPIVIGLRAPLWPALLAVLPRLAQALAAQRACRRAMARTSRASEHRAGPVGGPAVGQRDAPAGDVEADSASRDSLCGTEVGYSFATSSAVSSADFTDSVRDFRAERDSTASTMAIMTMRALLLCRYHGLDMDDRVTFMVDLRRYLPRESTVDGNFSWSKSVPVTDSDTPEEVGARITRVVDSGLPLLAYTADVLRRSLIRSSRMTPAPAGTNVRVMMSYATRWPVAPPPAGPDTPRIAVGIAPPGPGFVGFNAVEAYGRIHVTLNWCTATLDPERAARIATEFVADPGTCPVDAALWDRRVPARFYL